MIVAELVFREVIGIILVKGLGNKKEIYLATNPALIGGIGVFLKINHLFRIVYLGTINIFWIVQGIKETDISFKNVPPPPLDIKDGIVISGASTDVVF